MDTIICDKFFQGLRVAFNTAGAAVLSVMHIWLIIAFLFGTTRRISISFETVQVFVIFAIVPVSVFLCSC